MVLHILKLCTCAFVFLAACFVEANTVQKVTRQPTNFTVRIALFDNENSTNAWTFPHKVYVTKRIYAEIQLKWTNAERSDSNYVITPKDCYFSTNSNPTADTHHHIIQAGCAKTNSSVIYYPSTVAYRRRFSILIDSIYFPNRAFMFLHCKAVICASDEANVDEKLFDMCPLDYCPQPGFVNSADADGLHVFSGPLQPLMLMNHDTVDDAPPPSWTVNGRAMPPNGRQPVAQEEPPCAPCTPEPVHEARVDKTAAAGSGGSIDTATLFCVAIVSFVIGVFLMASLCYIHKITEPKNLATAKMLQKSLSGGGANNHHCRMSHSDEESLTTRPLSGEHTASTRVSFSASSLCTPVAAASLGECTATTMVSADSVLLLPRASLASEASDGI